MTYQTARGPVEAVSEASFEVAAGETYGLVGESGCGKTTLGGALSGHPPRGGEITGGRVHVDGTDVLALPPAELRRWHAASLAVVHQDAGGALDPTMRVGAQLAEVLRLQGRSRRAARAEVPELLDRVRLPDPAAIARRYPHQLSGGQQQRVVIAAALAARPRLLVLDEPTTGLDATVQHEVLTLIWALRAELGAAVVLISHDLALVGRLCDRVGVLYAGRFVEQGPAEEVLAAPRHPYTAALLASAPRLGMTRRTAPLAAIPGRPPAPGEAGQGCAFAARCAHADDRCRAFLPALGPVPGLGPRAHRTVRCHHAAWLADLPNPASLHAPDHRHDGNTTGGTDPAGVAGGTDPAGGRGTAAGTVRRAGAGAAAPGPQGDPATLLEVRGLVRRYGRLTVVDEVDLTIARGEVLGLVGESGSGKTTLARAVAGLGPPGPGTITLDGRRLAAGTGRREPQVRRRIQMVFQNPDASLNPRHTARTVLARALRSLRGPLTVNRLAERAGLDPRLLDARTDRLSGGQKQRVAIARAFAGDPDLVVCDEPVSALDVSVQAGVLRLLAEQQRLTGTAYLFISHDLAVVGYLADRIAVMYRGRIVERGPAEDVLTGPHHPYTASLIAASSATFAETPRGETAPGGPAPDGEGPLVVVKGTAGATPAGCRFAHRCPSRIDGLCDTTDPPVRTLTSGDGGHSVLCHLDLTGLPRAALPVSVAGKEESPA
ncbi:ABC transporter ATP-binding protein [Sphaerisporangium sp. NPDC004334]